MIDGESNRMDGWRTEETMRIRQCKSMNRDKAVAWKRRGQNVLEHASPAEVKRNWQGWGWPICPPSRRLWSLGRGKACRGV